MMMMTMGDDGMHPVHEILKIDAGRDFEKCVRWNTTFHYNSYNGGSETHDTFWKGRRFEVLMVPATKNCNEVWVKGKVVSWYEYNMGPGDRIMKWTLTATMDPESSTIGVGSLVYHPKKEGDSYALITQIDGQKCALEDGSTTFTEDTDKLRLYDSDIDFHVSKMNVQGGGILKCHSLKNHGLLRTMNWLDKVTEKEGDEDGFHSGCWYFDPTQRLCDPANMEVTDMRRKNIEKLNDDEESMIRADSQFLQDINRKLMREIVKGSTPYSLNVISFQHVLLSIPFLLYDEVSMYWFALYKDEAQWPEHMSKDNWCLIFYSFVKIGMYLWKDEERHRANSKLESLICQNLSDDFGLTLQMNSIIYQLVKRTGEWYESANEFRAAIWCYNYNLSLTRDPNVMFPPDAREDCECAHLSYLGLAYKSMDNFVEAANYYEEAIIAFKAMESPKVEYSMKENSLRMCNQAQHWYGTTGRLVSWSSIESGNSESSEWKCKACGADGATKKCSSCHTVAYCNVECQKVHWKKSHKITCLGKLRKK